MYGLFIATGRTAVELGRAGMVNAWPGTDSDTAFLMDRAPAGDDPGLLAMRAVPAGDSPTEGVVWSGDGQVGVIVDGYLFVEGTGEAPQDAQIRAFAERCRRDGTAAALRSVVAGSYVVLVVDRFRKEWIVANDAVGSIPLFQARVEGGWLFSTNPVAIARTGLVAAEMDMTAVAQWIYIGHTIGDRFLWRDLKLLPANTRVRISEDGAAERGLAGADPNAIPEPGPAPTLDEVEAAFRTAVLRIRSAQPAMAHLQSAGYDSRYILANWPEGDALPCYTYGDPASHEIDIAREVAALRGAPFVHVWATGDEVADALDGMFDSNGLYVFPDRYITARRARRDGLRGLTDGLFGDVLSHGFRPPWREFSRLSHAADRLLMVVDQPVSRISVDRFVDVLDRGLLEVSDDRELRRWINPDFLAALRAERPAIRQDIEAEVRRLWPANDSVLRLWRRFKRINRSPHSIVQQGVMSRAFVNIYYPFSNDAAFFRTAMRVPPGQASHRKLSRQLFRKFHPEYGRIRYGRTLLPINANGLRHRLSAAAVARNFSIPLVTGRSAGREWDANGWAHWFRTSERLREAAAGELAASGLADRAQLSGSLQGLADGSLKGHGKLMHVSAMARWMRLGRAVSAGAGDAATGLAVGPA